jgi:alkanesulfonate monooxygenase SsuD/methylene tetrahydromethanopterin reductase-like flavin-dependent oxidoreductase (luciferase family)
MPSTLVGALNHADEATGQLYSVGVTLEPGTGMDIGVYVPQLGLSYDEVLHRARRCEQLGIGSLWLYDHLYAPGFPNLPSLEAWTLATALLSATERLRVGHMVLCNQFRDPVLLAKMATTLDQISAGRLQLGIGSGSIEDEHQRAGLPWGTFAQRSERLAETLEILLQAFTAGSIDFSGAHYTVHDMPIAPGPVQQPHPPIVVGGVGEKYTLPLVARYADVWNIPTYALGDLEQKVSALRSACAEIGRDPDSITLSVEVVMALAPDDASLPKVRALAEKRFGGPGFGLHDGGLVGTSAVVVERLLALRALGFAQVVLFTHDRASDDTLELLAAEVLPHV